ncbi:MAG: DUF6602 domain-containing protein [Thiolinea sp.]
MPLPFIETIINSLNREVLERLDLSKAIKHPAENGRAREQIISEYLKSILPKNVKIDTGFIIDACGAISNQIDIVVYRDDYHSVLEIGKVKYFMIESVLAVIENKASILSSSVLQSALNNIRSVKKLDRTNRGKNVVLPTGRNVERHNFQHQVFGAIITENSLSTETLKNEFINFFNLNVDMKLWPNIYVDIRGSSVRYIKRGFEVTAVPLDAYGLIISNPDAENYTPPLLEITFELLNFIRITPLIDYNPCDYFYGTVGEVKVAIEFPQEILDANRRIA